MPHLVGKEPAGHMTAAYPHTKIPFTPAYGKTAIIQHGLSGTCVAPLKKPFMPSARAHTSREGLHQPGASKPDDAQEAFESAKIHGQGKFRRSAVLW